MHGMTLFSQKRILFGLICLSVFLSLLADCWPCKKHYFFSQDSVTKIFDNLADLKPGMRYSRGHGGESHESLAYLSLIKIVHRIIPSRIFCLRISSLLASLAALLLLYRIALELFSRWIALLFLFLLSTSPVYLESMRTLSFIPLSNLVVAAALYFIVSGLNNRRVFLKTLLLAGCCFLTMSLYVIGRLVALFAIVYFGLYLRRDWRKLMIFLLLLVGPLLLLDLALGDKRFNLKDAVEVGPEWLKMEPGRVEGTLKNRVRSNFILARDSLLQRERRPFEDEDHRSRLFNLFYTPFFLIGILLCLVRLKRSNLFLLLWFALFFTVPLGSSWWGVRRIVFALPPIYLSIALGLEFVFRLLQRSFSSAACRNSLTGVSLALLAVIGGWDIHEFLFLVAKPTYNYSRGQLQSVAFSVMEEGRGNSFIWCVKPSRDLILGNPYFIDGVTDLKFSFRVRSTCDSLRTVVNCVLRRGGSELFIYNTAPCFKRHYPPEYHEQLLSDLEWIQRTYPDLMRFSEIPGTGLRCISISPARKEDLVTQEIRRENTDGFQVFAVRRECKTGETVRLEAAHARPGKEGGFRMVAYADTDGNNAPDRLTAVSEYFEATESGQWSRWEFATEEDNIFVGIAWKKGTAIYRSDLEWPKELNCFSDRYYYSRAPGEILAGGPASSNLRVYFLQ